MSGQEQTNLSPHQEIQNLETIIQQLESEIRNVENTSECQALKRVTINFFYKFSNQGQKQKSKP